MDRRHCRQLVRRQAEPVHRLSVAIGGVDVAVEQPRRRHRQQLDQQAREGREHQCGAHAGVRLAVAQEHPQQEDEQPGEVHRRVVQVRRLDEERVTENEPLQVVLRRQPEIVLDVLDPASPVECARGAEHRQFAGPLP
jgi:hypothetical protein